MAEKIRARDLWATPKLNGRALDRAIVLHREDIFPLPLFHKMTEEFSKTADVMMTVLEGEIERFRIMNCWSPQVAGRALALAIAQQAGWTPAQKIEPLRGETLEDLDALNEKAFDEWIKTLEKEAGIRVSRLRSASPSH
jgi:hypothetical protein